MLLSSARAPCLRGRLSSNVRAQIGTQVRKRSILTLLFVSIYAPLAEAADPLASTQPTSGAASIYVYWVPNVGGRPLTLGLSLLANEQDLGPLISDEYLHIAVPPGKVTLRLVRRPPEAEQISFHYAARLPPLTITAGADAVHYVEFRYRELIGGGEGPTGAGGFAVANVEFEEVAAEVALPIINARSGR